MWNCIWKGGMETGKQRMFVQYLSPMTLEMGLTQPFNCIKKNVLNIKAHILGNNGLKVMLAFRTNMPADNQVCVSATKGSLNYIRGNDVYWNHAAVCGAQNPRYLDTSKSHRTMHPSRNWWSRNLALRTVLYPKLSQQRVHWSVQRRRVCSKVNCNL